MSDPHKYSWDMPPGTGAQIIAMAQEASSVGMSPGDYRKLSVPDRRKLLGVAPSLEVTSEGVRLNGEPVQTRRSARELHTDDKAAIGIIAGGFIGAGLIGEYEGHPWLGAVYFLAGLVMLVPLSPFVRSRIGWIYGRSALWTLAVSLWLLLAADVALRIWPFPGIAPLQLQAENLPNSPRGLPPGAKWNDGGIVAVVGQPQTDSAFAPFAVVGGPYLQDEINRMILAVGQLNDILLQQAPQSVATVQGLLRDWQSQLNQDGPESYSKKIFEANNAVGAVAVALGKVLDTNARFHDEISPTLNTPPPGPLSQELYDFGTNIRITASASDTIKGAILTRDYQRVSNAFGMYQMWLNNATNYTQQKLANLRAYKSGAK